MRQSPPFTPYGPWLSRWDPQGLPIDTLGPSLPPPWFSGALTFREHPQRVIQDLWDIWSVWWGDMTWPTKRQWQRQRLGMCQCSCKQLLQHKFCLQRQFGENIFGWKQLRGWRKQWTGEKQLGTGAAHNYEFLWWLKIWWHWMQAKPNIYLIIGLHT